jgi:hypothetical protein
MFQEGRRVRREAHTAISGFANLVVKLARQDRQRVMGGKPAVFLTNAEAWMPCRQCGERFDGVSSRNTLCLRCFWAPFEYTSTCTVDDPA